MIDGDGGLVGGGESLTGEGGDLQRDGMGKLERGGKGDERLVERKGEIFGRGK